MMSGHLRLMSILVLIGALAATGWALWMPRNSAPAPATDPALERLRVQDGETNPLVIGDAIAGSAEMWRSSQERGRLERRAYAGDASASFKLYQYYAFTTDDRASARGWLERAARGGNEIAQFNLAVEIGGSDCSEAKRRLRKIADQTTNTDTRKSALSWIGDAYLCAPKGPTD